MKPRIFIGSSSEGEEVARAVEQHLAPHALTKLWLAGAFGPSETFIESLEGALASAEFSVLIVTPDDLRVKRSREGKVPRDNVVFELGLFMGRLGRSRTFAICDPGTVELPTDLSGVSVAAYDSKRSDGDIRAAVSPAVTDILGAIKKVPRVVSRTREAVPALFLMDDESLYHYLVRWPAREVRITVQSRDTNWVWSVIPTLLHWRINDTDLRVFAPPVISKRRDARSEMARRDFLRRIGVQFIERPDARFSGFFLSGRYPEDDIAIVPADVSRRDGGPLYLRYEARHHPAAVEALLQGLPAWDVEQSGLHVPSLEPTDVSEVISLLKKGVRQYEPANVKMEATEVSTQNLLAMSSLARAYKYRQVELLKAAYDTLGEDAFKTLSVRMSDGGKSIVTPPVVEMRDSGPVVMEGTTRALYCRRNKIESYHCICVHGVADPLPGHAVPIDQLGIAERTLTHTERTQDFEPRNYRHIERAVHPY